jgi:RNA polymerase sigma-70 factor (ECF subfamily)
MEFPATSWTMIRGAQQAGSPEYERHLRRLVELYWRPIYFVIRHSWHRTPEEAQDLTQEFFAVNVLERRMISSASPERGSFRALLRTAIGHFMANVHRDAQRFKRGGGAHVLSIDAGDVESDELAAAAAALSPEQAFDLAWNRAIVQRALGLLQKRLGDSGRATAWQAFRRYELEGDRERMSYEELGRALDMTAAQVKHALIAARAEFKDIVTDIVREYADGADDLAAELRTLLAEP